MIENITSFLWYSKINRLSSKPNISRTVLVNFTRTVLAWLSLLSSTKNSSRRGVFGLNYNQKLVPVKPSRRSLVAMTVTAVNRPVFSRLERELGYFRSAFGALPVSLEHRARRKILIWLILIEGHRLSPRFLTVPRRNPELIEGRRRTMPPPNTEKHSS